MASEIRVNQIQSRTGVSTISFTETGPIISGVTTITGDLDVTGLVSYEDVTNIDSIGIVTARKGIVSSGVVTATAFHGDGSQLTGIDATQIVTGNTSVQTVDTGSDGHVKFNTEGSERLRITSDGKFGYGTATPGCFFEVSDDAAGATVQQKLINRNTAANSSTNQFIYVNNSGAGDPFTTWTVGGVTSWSMGIDNSDSDKLKITAASNLNSNQYLSRQ